MPRIFPVTIRRTTTVAGGAVNWLARTKPAVALGSIGRLLVSANPAVRLSQRATLLVAQKPAVRLTATTSGTAKPSVKPAAKLTPQATLLMSQRPAIKTTTPMQMVTTEKVAPNIVQVTFDLIHGNWVQTGTAFQDTGGNWNNVANMEGAGQGTEAGSASLDEGIVLTQGTIRGNHAAQPNRPADLVILNGAAAGTNGVWLDFYTKGRGITLGVLSSLVHGFRFNTTPIPGTDTAMGSPSPVHDNLVTPRSVRIDNAGANNFLDALSTPLTWANVALVQPYCTGTILVDAGLAHFYVDAVKLRVFALATWNP